MSNKKDYLKTHYNPELKPFTDYPNKFINYLIEKNKIKKNSKVLDLCCGRGEFINEFINFGCEGFAVDIDDICLKYFPKIDYKNCDLTKDKIPWEDNTFDVIFNKSVIEHFSEPHEIIKECYRVLKPGGIIITLTPSWKHNINNFYDDYTHKQPFNIISIGIIHESANFRDINSEYFIQLPKLWKKNLFSKFMLLVSIMVRYLAPNNFKKKFKFIKFSKEVMLICTGKK